MAAANGVPRRRPRAAASIPQTPSQSGSSPSVRLGEWRAQGMELPVKVAAADGRGGRRQGAGPGAGAGAGAGGGHHHVGPPPRVRDQHQHLDKLGARRADAVVRVLIPAGLARLLPGAQARRRTPLAINLNIHQVLVMGCLTLPVVWALLALSARYVDAGLARVPRDDKACNLATWKGVLPANAQITNVTFVPKGGSAHDGPTNILYPTPPADLPECCAVTVQVQSSPSSSYRFGLLLPSRPHDWKQRFFAVGNGGFGGGERPQTCLLLEEMSNRAQASTGWIWPWAPTSGRPASRRTRATAR